MSTATLHRTRPSANRNSLGNQTCNMQTTGILESVLEPGQPVTIRRSIPRVSPRSPQTARAWTRTSLTVLGLDPGLAELAVSEFITNVLRYAAGSALITLAAYEGAIEVACTDRHPETADAVHPYEETDGDGVTGRGLFILAMLAIDGVHVEADPRRKRVTVRFLIGDAS